MKRFALRTFCVCFCFIVIPFTACSWGFFAHKQINRLAVFTLPAEMAVFYKRHLEYITEKAVLPDKRRFIVKEEAPRHFIDLDFYRDSAGMTLPISWDSIRKSFPEDFLHAHGILPWHLYLMKVRLTDAFKIKDTGAILRLSADLGHYVADAHVPLHTCSNYNGQFTGQQGIHGLWESRLPEIYFDSYDFFVGSASYIDKPYAAFWNTVFESNALADSVLVWEKELTSHFPSDRKYGYEERGNSLVKVYSEEFCKKYHEQLSGMVERRMRSAVKMLGSIWYTCWADAGQPDLKDLLFDENASPKEVSETNSNGDDPPECKY